MGSLAAALVALSQGVVFFHAGDEILRSKSLDRDSYGSGAKSGTVSVRACFPRNTGIASSLTQRGALLGHPFKRSSPSSHPRLYISEPAR